MLADLVPLARRAAADAVAVILPVDCAGCGAPDRAVCAACRAALRPDVLLVRHLDSGLRVHAAHRYDGAVRRVILALKEQDRTDCASALAAALRPALAAVGEAVRELPGAGPVELVAIPSSWRARRRRGYDPVRLLLARCGVRSSRLLRPTRSRDSQKSLGVADRGRNALGSLSARGDLSGRRVLLVDDVVTTGATLREAERALRAAGAEVLGAVVVAATPLRADSRGASSGLGDPAERVRHPLSAP